MMPADARLAELMPDTVSLVTRLAPNKYGEPSRTWEFSADFGDEVTAEIRTYPARIEERSVKAGGTTRDDGAAGRVFILGDPPLEVDDLLILPDGSEPIVRAVKRARDEAGAHHLVVEFSR